MQTQICLSDLDLFFCCVSLAEFSLLFDKMTFCSSKILSCYFNLMLKTEVMHFIQCIKSLNWKKY